MNVDSGCHSDCRFARSAPGPGSRMKTRKGKGNNTGTVLLVGKETAKWGKNTQEYTNELTNNKNGGGLATK